MPAFPGTTSIHSLNADKGLGLAGKMRWLTLNARNNASPFAEVDESMRQTEFVAKRLDANWELVPKNYSPARRLCDLFWRELPLDDFERDLGGKVRAVEVGCGSGVYGALLQELLAGRAHYRGLDIVANPAWEKYAAPNFEFAIADSADLKAHLEGMNFLFTQSALEHFEEDLTFFRHVADIVRTRQEPLIQVHLLPSASCITTFPWHGIRQYTPRTLSRVTTLFEGAKKSLYSLGSARCNEVHRRWITWPSITRRPNRRKTALAQYESEVRRAIRADMDAPVRGKVCFYALVIQTGKD